jgi:hypothetical protein
MTTSNQKDRELKQIKKAFNLLGVRYSEIEKDKESPDFIVEIDGNLTGIEVTEIYPNLGDGNSAKTQSDLPKIYKEAVKIYSQENGEPYQFGFAFNGNAAVRNRSCTARELAVCLLEQTKELPDQLAESHTFTPDLTKYPSLHPIDFIYAKKIDGLVSMAGIMSSVFNPVQLGLNEVESAIQKKAIILTNYLQRCDDIWLLITLPSMMFSRDFILPDSEFTVQQQGFKAIYLLDDYRNEIQCVNQCE